MTEDTQLDPHSDAQRILNICCSSTAGNISIPVDPREIARIYDIDVFEHVFNKNFPRDIVGYLDWDHKGAFIVINNIYKHAYQRFAIAREIGRYFYYQQHGFPYEKKTAIKRLIQTTPQEDDYCASFARSLLMPEQELNYKISLTDDVQILSRVFDVPEQEMINRMEEVH